MLDNIDRVTQAVHYSSLIRHRPIYFHISPSSGQSGLTITKKNTYKTDTSIIMAPGTI